MLKTAIVDTSVLIALDKIHLLGLLCKLYDEIILPEAVIDEFGPLSIKCIIVKQVKSPMVNLLKKNSSLGQGESEVIALAYESGAITLVIDDLTARKTAETLKLKVTGTIGVLLKAQEMGLIKSAYQKAVELKNKGFYVSEGLLQRLKIR